MHFQPVASSSRVLVAPNDVIASTPIAKKTAHGVLHRPPEPGNEPAHTHTLHHVFISTSNYMLLILQLYACSMASYNPPKKGTPWDPSEVTQDLSMTLAKSTAAAQLLEPPRALDRRTSATARAHRSNALDGTQPTFRQSPGHVGRALRALSDVTSSHQQNWDAG